VHLLFRGKFMPGRRLLTSLDLDRLLQMYLCSNRCKADKHNATIQQRQSCGSFAPPDEGTASLTSQHSTRPVTMSSATPPRITHPWRTSTLHDTFPQPNLGAEENRPIYLISKLSKISKLALSASAVRRTIGKKKYKRRASQPANWVQSRAVQKKKKDHLKK
jgi:hypothetical protein